jgi:hypothetical protein
MMRIYRALLRFYPEGFRAAFADEILVTLARVEAERAKLRSISRILLSGREIAGLVAGVFAERFRLGRSRYEVPAIASGRGFPPHVSVSSEIAELEESIRFHLAQTIDCIAHHKFEGARFHAREEERARQRLSMLRDSSRLPD